MKSASQIPSVASTQDEGPLAPGGEDEDVASGESGRRSRGRFLAQGASEHR